MRDLPRAPLALITTVVLGAVTLSGCGGGEEAVKACQAACQQTVRNWVKAGSIGGPPTAVTAYCADKPNDPICLLN